MRILNYLFAKFIPSKIGSYFKALDLAIFDYRNNGCHMNTPFFSLIADSYQKMHSSCNELKKVASECYRVAFSFA